MSLGERAFSSSFIIVAATWAQRLFGIVSLVVLARILAPEDFGIVAMSAIVIRLFEALVQTGPEQYLLSRKTIDDDALSTAWTLNFISKAAIGVLVFLMAPLIADLFKEPKLVLVLQVSTIIPFLNGLQNTGQFLLKRDFNYLPLAKWIIITKVVSFVVTLTIAVTYQTYWAMVVGDIAFAFTLLVSTFIVSPFRPRFRILGVKKQWMFSKWVLFRSMLGYTRAKVDQFIIASSYPTNIVGMFHISKEFAILPHNQLSEPLTAIFMSSINEEKHDLQRTADVYNKILVVLVTVMLPIVVGLILVKDVFAHVILGEQWVGAAPILAILAPITLTYALATASSATLTALELVKRTFILDGITFLMVTITLFLARNNPIFEFAFCRMLLGVSNFLVFYFAVRMTLPVKTIQPLLATLPAVMGAVAMAILLTLLKPYFETLPQVLSLILQVSLGVVAYCSVCIGAIYAMSSFVPPVNFLMNTFQSLVVDKIIHRYNGYRGVTQ